jgi:phage baseplate assembly protein W
MADVPHFSLPFRFGPPAAVTEQDSIDEIADCCVAVMLCPAGFRVELQEFGIPDPTFSSPEVDVTVIRQAVERWEPRASLQITEHTDPLDELTARVDAFVQLRAEE